jgi:hypothetical protein
VLSGDAAGSGKGGSRVLFCDQRRFGTGIVLLGGDALEDYFAKQIPKQLFFSC